MLVVSRAKSITTNAPGTYFFMANPSSGKDEKTERILSTTIC